MLRSVPGDRLRLADPAAALEVLERVDREEDAALAHGSARRAHRSPRRSCRARAGAGSRARASRSRRRRLGVDDAHLVAADLLRGELARSGPCRRASTRRGASRSARSRRAPRRRSTKSCGVGCEVVGVHGRRAQPLVELVRAELDVVAEALVAEADVERDDAPVREALRRVREVGRRVEDDRGVLARQVHLLTSRLLPGLRGRSRRAPRPCATQRGARARAASYSSRPAEAVRQTTATPGPRPRDRTRPWTPSRSGSR